MSSSEVYLAGSKKLWLWTMSNAFWINPQLPACSWLRSGPLLPITISAPVTVVVIGSSSRYPRCHQRWFLSKFRHMHQNDQSTPDQPTLECVKNRNMRPHKVREWKFLKVLFNKKDIYPKYNLTCLSSKF